MPVPAPFVGESQLELLSIWGTVYFNNACPLKMATHKSFMMPGSIATLSSGNSHTSIYEYVHR